MGFWHTGYMEFHEETGWDGPRAAPEPPKFPCSQCRRVFGSSDDLAVHVFDGHVTTRPVLMLRGRECGRSRLSVISATTPEDWSFHNARAIHVNGELSSEGTAKTLLCSEAVGVVSVLLQGERADQEFEFSFSVANEPDLQGVDEQLKHLVRGRSLTINAIEAFLDRTRKYRTARTYRDGLANYFYGVLARERSPESGLLDVVGNGLPYAERFDDAVVRLGNFDRPAAEAICGLVAFHYNQFDVALRKTRSPRVARAARRFASLLDGRVPDDTDLGAVDRSSIDYVLSDTVIEQVLTWCCIPLDGTAAARVAEIETGLENHQPGDALKLRVIAAEHHLAAGQGREGLRHVDALRHSRVAEQWLTAYRERLAKVTA